MIFKQIEHKLLYRYVIKYNKGVYSSYKPNKKCGIGIGRVIEIVFKNKNQQIHNILIYL